MAISGTWEDREQIRELYSRYAYTVDFGPYSEWVDCFTEDGIFESPVFGQHKGPQGLLKFTALYKESQAGAQVRHVMSNVTFAISGDSATGGCYLTYYHCKDGKVSLTAVGRYEDKLRRVGGEWRFGYRKVHLDGRP